ncbi:MAG: KH domain-containing protein [Candidatus Aminicenantes bacterium]|nr:KH domain-containing protein [Candidatus Aminicenantes bacterium]
MKELVETVCKALVDMPDDVKVTQIDGEQTSILELRVHQSDLGKVIGKQGRTARAIRIILAAAGMKQKRRFNLEIIENFDDYKAPKEPESP